MPPEHKNLEIYGAIEKLQHGDWRAIRVTDEGYLVVSGSAITASITSPLDAFGHVETSEVTSFFPSAGTFQSVSIGVGSLRNTVALTPLVPYIIWASGNCHIKVGDVAVTASAVDPHIPSNACFEIILAAGETNIAVIQSSILTSAGTNYLTIFRSSR
jgi:hypothetical protein